MTAAWTIALVGGVLIGLAATLLLWLDGRIAGVSGILGGVLMPQKGDVAWRAAFLVGLVAAAGLWTGLAGEPPAARPDFPRWALLAAGLLVGFGTRMGNGCTSGHGVCGLGRLSVRSLAAVLTFMAAAIASTWVARHLGGIA